MITQSGIGPEAATTGSNTLRGMGQELGPGGCIGQVWPPLPAGRGRYADHMGVVMTMRLGSASAGNSGMWKHRLLSARPAAQTVGAAFEWARIGLRSRTRGPVGVRDCSTAPLSAPRAGRAAPRAQTIRSEGFPLEPSAARDPLVDNTSRFRNKLLIVHSKRILETGRTQLQLTTSGARSWKLNSSVL